jgi:hypothetical protein
MEKLLRGIESKREAIVTPAAGGRVRLPDELERGSRRASRGRRERASPGDLAQGRDAVGPAEQPEVADRLAG